MLRNLIASTDKKLLDMCAVTAVLVGSAMVIDFVKLIIECL